MSTQQQVLRRSELMNRLVLDRNTVEDLGRIEQIWINSQSHQVVGFTCKLGILNGHKQLFNWDKIDKIGEDAILVHPNQETAKLTKSQQQQALASGRTVTKPEPAIHGIGHEVWTNAGNKVGTIIDYLFDIKTGFINDYLYKSDGWRGALDGIYQLPVTAISSTGSKRLIVLESVVRSPQKYTQGLSQKVGQAAEFLQEDLEKTLEHLEGLKRGAQKLTGTGKESGVEIESEMIQQEAKLDSEPKCLPPITSEPNSSTTPDHDSSN